MKKTTDIPIHLLQILEPFINENSKHYEIQKSEDNLLIFRGKGINVDNCFIINSYRINGATYDLTVTRKPYSKIDSSTKAYTIPAGSLKDIFNEWKTILEEYNRLNNLFSNDQNWKRFENEFFDEFSLEDDNSYLSSKEILKVNEILEQLKLSINKDDEHFDSDFKSEIISEINSIDESLTLESKYSVGKKIAALKAKLFTKSVPFFKKLGHDTIVKILAEIGSKYLTGQL